MRRGRIFVRALAVMVLAVMALTVLALTVLALGLLLPGASGTALAGAVFLGPGRGLTGNDTGGIIAYAPHLPRGAYREMAANWCARWGRGSHITSMHRFPGDYVGFVCIDRPGVIH